MLGFNLSVGRNRQSFGDADAQAFINATGLTSTTEVNAVKTLVANLKTYGLWSKMKAIYPFVSDTVNLLSYTQDFSNAYWPKNGLTVATDTTIAPDGTLTADTLTAGATGNRDIELSITLSNTSYSIYAKKGNYDQLTILNLGTTCNVRFDLTLGTFTIVSGSGFTPSIVNVGNGWYRCIISNIASTTQIRYYVGANTGDYLYLWGAQAENNTSATTYQPIATTPANRFVSQFKYNLKDPRDLDAAFRLAFNGTWAYSKQGATPNGVNAYADTYYLESANATLNSGHISYYSRTNIAGNPFMGASNGTTETNIYPNNGGTFYPRIQATNSGVPSVNLNAAAYFIASRINATEVNGYRNTTKYTVSNPTVSLNNLRRYYLGAGNDSTIRYNANQTAFSTIGDGLNDSEASTLYTLVQNFQTTLGRQV